jgi:hypothetical protein
MLTPALESNYGTSCGKACRLDPRKATTLEDYFYVALDYCEKYHAPTVQYYREITPDKVDARYFWSEYIWCVYTSGFNAKVVTKHFPALMAAYGPWDASIWESRAWAKVKDLIGNKRKCHAIIRTRTWMRDMGWERFQREYLNSPDALAQLPFVGSITKFHLARNLGMDAVKPDIHLERVAERFQAGTPDEMCHFLSGLSGERIGVVDFIIWSFCAAFGSREEAA